MRFHLQSPNFTFAPTIAEADGIRERGTFELVHQRTDDDHPVCIHCGVRTDSANCWTDSKELFQRNAMRCSQ